MGANTLMQNFINEGSCLHLLVGILIVIVILFVVNEVISLVVFRSSSFIMIYYL